jgi:predicted enzyme related to lactoylglutathione lyase
VSYVTSNQPDGTPTWIDLGIPDLDRAMAFYRALFGWDFDVGPEETGRYATCLLDGRAAAGLAPNPDPDATAFWWNVYLATSDCDGTAKRVTDSGGTLVQPPMDVMDQGRMALARDPVGAQFGLWQGRARVGCEVVNEPGALVRNDLVTPNPEPARAFYAAVFGFTLDGNQDLPGFDFTFLRRPDGHEVGGVIGVPDAPSSAWSTTFEVADSDAVAAAAGAAGGRATAPEEFVYGRMATITDPFGTEFSVIARPAGGS